MTLQCSVKKLATIDTESPVEFFPGKMQGMGKPGIHRKHMIILNDWNFKNLLSRFDQQETEQKELPFLAYRRRFRRSGEYLETGRTGRTR